MVKDYSSIIVSSRVRLSRCLENVPFPSKMTAHDGEGVISSVYNAITQCQNFKLYKMKDLQKNDAYILQEKHLISPDLIENNEFGAVCINDDENIAIMINEEDHLREQCLLPGLNIEKAFGELDIIDNALCKKLAIAYDDNLGFLTSCVSNVGTGLRVSVMLFLPALTISGKVENLISTLKKSGLAVRGAYGEETDYLGYLYQISNERTLGKNEKEYCTLVSNIAKQICDIEIEERKKLLLSRLEEVTDIINRAYGILTNCNLLGVEEFMKLAGQVKMGIALNLVRMKDNFIVDKLLNTCTSYTLCKIAGNITNTLEEQKYRAQYVSKVLKNNRIK